MPGPGFTALFGGGNLYQANPTFLSLNPMAASQQLSWPIEQNFSPPYLADIIEVNATAPGLFIQFDDATIPNTGYTTLINNIGANTISVHDFGGNVVATVASGEVWQIYLADNSTQNGTWRVFQFGAGASSANAAALAGAGLKAITTTLNEKMLISAHNANYVIVNGDRANPQVWTGGVGAFTLPDATVVGADWFTVVKNAGTGVLTLNLVGGQTIDSLPNLTMNPDTSTFIITDGTQFFTVGFGQEINSVFDFIQIDISGTGNFVLAGAQLNRISYRFVGNLTGNRQIVIPPTIQQYWIDNETTGAFTLTVGTVGLGGTITPVAQGARNILYCDSVNTVPAVTISNLTFVSGTPAAPGVAFTADTTTGLYFVGPHTLGFATNGLARGTITDAGYWRFGPPDNQSANGFLFTGGIGGGLTPTFNVAAHQQTSVSPGFLLSNLDAGGFSILSIASSNAIVGTSDLAIFQLPSNDVTILNRALQALVLGTAGNNMLTLSANGELTIAQPSGGIIGSALTITARNANQALSLISPTAAQAMLRINNSATTGGATPTLGANKPGANSAVDKWVPIFLDGVLHYIPAWT